MLRQAPPPPKPKPTKPASETSPQDNNGAGNGGAGGSTSGGGSSGAAGEPSRKRIRPGTILDYGDLGESDEPMPDATEAMDAA